MPVEIRELVIKTALETRPAPDGVPLEPTALESLRREILAECERMLREHQPRQHLER